MYCKNCGKQIEDESKFCEYCGVGISTNSQQEQPIQTQNEFSQPNYSSQHRDPRQDTYSHPKRREGIAELVIGIISIIMSLGITFQSCIVGGLNALSESEEASGSAGIMLSFCIFIAGIVGIVTRKGSGKGGAITASIFYLFGAIIGFSNVGSYSDLQIYSIISLIFCAVFIWMAISRKGRE
jgi:uncharacterized membrane protein YfcA